MRRIVFIEDYDYNVARHLVQGVDVWLNNPRRPLEACGTSGQKAILNGCLSLSVLDGWWNEAYDGRNGFVIGDGGMHNDPNIQYQRDADHLYNALEKEVIPCYYDRDTDGTPHLWVQRMKRSMQSLGRRFNADRMVKDYAEHCYLLAASKVASFSVNRAHTYMRHQIFIVLLGLGRMKFFKNVSQIIDGFAQ